jgi:RNA polymerase sigma-70 factor (sigma-E family)
MTKAGEAESGAIDTGPPVETDLGALVGRQQARLFRVAVCVCGDPYLAEEAVAEAIARSWPALRRGGVDDPAAYLRRAVLNVLQGRFRRAALERRARERRQHQEHEHDQADAVAERDAVLRALAQLPERQRAVVVLRYYEGLSEGETAKAMGVPVGTVKSTNARATARLRVLLEGDRHG